VSDTSYKSQFLLVFQKKKVVMTTDLYNAYLSQGLFDPEHVIGNKLDWLDLKLANSSTFSPSDTLF
jgi:hypothetical protein